MWYMQSYAEQLVVSRSVNNSKLFKVNVCIWLFVRLLLTTVDWLPQLLSGNHIFLAILNYHSVQYILDTYSIALQRPTYIGKCQHPL